MSDNITPNPDLVTHDWLKETLQKSLKTENVQIVELVPIKTDGYLSRAFKATIRIDDNPGEKIFIKISLSSDDPFQDFIQKYHIDVIEVKAYSEMLPKLMEFEKSRWSSKKSKLEEQ